MNKPFLLIAGDKYYPANGTYDWIDRFETYEEAESKVKKISTRTKKTHYVNYKVDGRPVDWYQIVNLETWEPNQ